MLYFFIITFTMIILTLVTFIISLYTNVFTITYSLVAPFFVNAYMLVIMGITTLVMRLLPKSLWNPKKKIYTVSKKEVCFLINKLKIKKWKDKIPEMGHTGGFPKKHILSLEKEYLFKFLQETCFAEIMHYISAIFGFTVLFFLDFKSLIFALPILITNSILHLLPSLIQRYNRFRILHVYQRNF